MNQAAQSHRVRGGWAASGRTVKVSLDAAYLTDQASGTGRIEALSTRGCVVEGSALPPVGSALHMVIPTIPGLAGHFPIASAVVTWVDGGRFGIEFPSMDADRLAQLRRCLTRLARRRPIAKHASPTSRRPPRMAP